MQKFFIYLFASAFVFLGVACLSTHTAYADNLYYSQPNSNGELWMGPYAPLTDHNEIQYWTEDRVNYLPIYGVSDSSLLFNGSQTGNTGTDQYVTRINLWISGDPIVGTYDAFFYCSTDAGGWSNSFDGSKLTSAPQEVTFTFPPTFKCNLKTNTITGLGVYLNRGQNYPLGLYFLGSNANGYAVKTEIWTSDRNTRTPVLIVPGIMGTQIFKQGVLLWPNVENMFLNIGDSFMDPLAYQSGGVPLDTSLNIGQVIDQVGNLNYTQKLVNDLISQGYSTSTNLFLFPYDWRRDDNDVAVTDDATLQNPSLKQTIDNILLSTGASKVDIIAHSQGGLVVKRLLYDRPEYEQKINKLIFVGTPNLGAPFAAKVLLYGDSLNVSLLGLGLAPSEVQKISQNMPAIYQLLPSPEYFNHASGYLGNLDPMESLIGGTNYNFSQTSQALKDLGENSSLTEQANLFHSSAYDNMDFSNSGIQTYNIIGCQSGTVGQILMGSDGKYHLNYRAGDGTVPVISASNIFGSQNYYSLDTGDVHGTMLTTDGIRQQIENILTGGSLPAANMTQDSSQCHYNGEQVSVHSPVDLQIYDETGGHVGTNPDGTFDYNINGVHYDTIGHNKFAYLPPGHIYTIKLPATGAGNFGFDASQIQDGQIINTAHYDSIPITASSVATVTLNDQNNQPIQLDVNGDGKNIQTIQPSSTLNAGQSQDMTPPVSTSTISGTLGQPGFYRSNVSITLSATDPVVNNNPAQVSGILKTIYVLDSSATTTYQSAINVTGEGSHTISFFSTDNAGNNEELKTINFTIDKTPPEAVIQFSPSLKDIQFTGSDNISTTSKVAVLDNLNDILLTDQAGNTTEIKLKEANRRTSKQATILTLSYNGAAQDMSKNILAFVWLYDKNNNLSFLSQNVAAKKTYIILAVYNGKNTSLVGLDKSGIILKSIAGLDLLKISTSKGDLAWSY